MANRKKRAAVSCCATGRVRTAMCGHATANCRAAADCHMAASCRATARRRAAAGCRTALSAGCRAVLAGLLAASFLPTVALAAPQQNATYDAAVEDLRPLVSTVVWDVTNPANIGRIEGGFADGTYTFTIPAGELREFVAITPEPCRRKTDFQQILQFHKGKRSEVVNRELGYIFTKQNNKKDNHRH